MEKMADTLYGKLVLIPRRTAFLATQRYGENGGLPFRRLQ
jgi:hypothetical protein